MSQEILPISVYTECFEFEWIHRLCEQFSIVESNRKKIGLLGGSFDPPHLGHLTLAQDAYEGLRLDAVWFVPTFLSPHKSSFHITPEARLLMVEKMIEKDPRFTTCDVEVASKKSQFSVHTVEFLQKEYPDIDFFWLIGADQLCNLHQWKHVDRLSNISQIVVFKRPGFQQQIPAEVQHLNLQQVDIHEILISSSEIRERVSSNLPVYMFLHPAVNQHIEQNKFYKNS